MPATSRNGERFSRRGGSGFEGSPSKSMIAKSRPRVRAPGRGGSRRGGGSSSAPCRASMPSARRTALGRRASMSRRARACGALGLRRDGLRATASTSARRSARGRSRPLPLARARRAASAVVWPRRASAATLVGRVGAVEDGCEALRAWCVQASPRLGWNACSSASDAVGRRASEYSRLPTTAGCASEIAVFGQETSRPRRLGWGRTAGGGRASESARRRSGSTYCSARRAACRSARSARAATACEQWVGVKLSAPPASVGDARRLETGPAARRATAGSSRRSASTYVSGGPARSRRRPGTAPRRPPSMRDRRPGPRGWRGSCRRTSAPRADRRRGCR